MRPRPGSMRRRSILLGRMASPGPTGTAPVLQLHPSRWCNLACAHCYSSSGPQAEGALGIELLEACLGDAAALGYRQLAVSGGEPLLYGDLPRLLRRARSLGMVATITTNGLLVDGRRWSQLADRLDFVAVSIDGDHATHDAIRGRRGLLERTIARLPIVRASGVPFGFIFTLTQHNLDSLDFVVRLAAAQGAAVVQVHPLTLHGRASERLPGARPDAIEMTVALIEARRLAEQLGIAVHVDALAHAQLLGFRDRLVPARPVVRLVDVAPILVVTADGTVLPLTHEVATGLALGSITARPLASLAHDWLMAGGGDRLALACARAWAELADADHAPAIYWYRHVAAQTWRRWNDQTVRPPRVPSDMLSGDSR